MNSTGDDHSQAAPRRSASEGSDPQAYWRKNLRILLLLLAAWFAVSFGCSILCVDALDRIRIPGTGFKLGFWFAQQGSIFVFVALIGIYVLYMNRLDRRFGVDEDRT